MAGDEECLHFALREPEGGDGKMLVVRDCLLGFCGFPCALLSFFLLLFGFYGLP